MDSEDSIFILEIKVYYFSVIIDTCTSTEKDYYLWVVLALLEKVKQEMHFLYPIFHNYVGIV